MLKVESRYFLGCALMSAYLLITAALDVYASNLTQEADPVRVLFWCFLITTCFFLIRLRAWNGRLFEKISDRAGAVFSLNITTAIAWFSFFLALKYTEPMIVATASSAVSPILAVFFSKILRPGTKTSRIELFSALGLLSLLVFSLCYSALGKSGLGSIAISQSIGGLVASVLCGAGVTCSSLFSKKLYDSNFKSDEVMASRFLFLIIFSGIYILYSNLFFPSSLFEWISISVISLGANIVGLSMLQKAIERLEPLTISFFFAAGPIAVIPFQLLDPRLHFSIFSIISSVLLLIFVFIGVLARSRPKDTEAGL